MTTIAKKVYVDENGQLVGVDITSEFASMMVTGGSATAIDTSSVWHGYIDAITGILSGGWTFGAGVRTALAGATFATASGGSETQITGVAHGLALNDYVTLSGCSTGGYNTTTSTVHQVTAVGGASDFTLDVAFIDDPGTEGFVVRADQLVAGAAAAGTHAIQDSASGFIAVSTATVQFGVFKNGTLQAKRDRKFTTATDRGAFMVANGLLFTVAEGDVVWIGVLNESNANDVTIGDMDFSIHKL
jgi:hypothetical protein